jgi:uncharacterized repeat protein (TIGR03847 family)
MPRSEIELDPVNLITIDAIGKPGQRVFYIQATKNDEVVTLIVEKAQVQTLAVGVEQFFAEIGEKYPNLSEASDEYDEDKMHIYPPVDPRFRVGELGLGYDAERDMLVLMAREVVGEGQEEEDVDLARFWVTRSQIRGMIAWGLEIVGRGRPICPQCGEPMDPEGHFCPKKNGHNRN